ncbi:MAG TPA: universal stress protein [Longimicrobium sp.]|jgi:nucleotide-binding universal stress UspA family protein|uniref:universal stress protein n=1 Tax=Longimicrobium sp. TaxID=2029185 RepID=UPI002ED9489A
MPHQPIRRVVAGVATLRPDDPALASALTLSARLGADLHLLHVDSPGAATAPPARTRELRALVEAMSPGALATGRVLCRATAGNPEQTLRAMSTAAAADLMVLGATRRGRLAGAVLGTTAAHVLRSTRIPMLVVREPLPGRPLRVLMTTDLSHHAAHAHARGLVLAQGLRGGAEPELRSLFVRPPALDEAPLAPVWPAEDAEGELAAFIRAEAPRAPIVPWVRTGDAAHEIVAAAREWQAGLVVVGTHGRRGIGRMFLGSVAETVVRHAPCAVLVIPPLRLYGPTMDVAGDAGGGALATAGKVA